MRMVYNTLMMIEEVNTKTTKETAMSVIDSIKNTISQFEISLAEKERAVEMNKGCIARCNWIVTVEGIAVNPEIVDGKTTGKITTGPAQRVVRFEKQDAEALAKIASNGNNTEGKAEFWVDVVKREIDNLKGCIKILKDRVEELEAA